MQIQALTTDAGDRLGEYAPSVTEKFTIFHGKANARNRLKGDSTLLAIQYIVYDTLVEGIHSAVQTPDFKGALLTDYELDGEQYHIVFAMWYSQAKHMYFLTSLGQYSTHDFLTGMRHFKSANEPRLKIKLAAIHPQGLAGLREKLRRSNLSGANVCLIEDTIETSEFVEYARNAA